MYMKEIYMEYINKIKLKKESKKSRILDSAMSLFLEKGINDTSIQDIVDRASIAKGTFYLYFKNKYEIQNELIIRQSVKIFDNAFTNIDMNIHTTLDDQILVMTDNIIKELCKNKLILKFISKNLTLGLYSSELHSILSNNEIKSKEYFVNKIKEERPNIKDPNIVLYMIVELTSSVCFSAIINKQPLSIEEMKPYLYDSILKLLN